PLTSLVACRSSVALFSSFTSSSPPEIYTLSLHDALPISAPGAGCWRVGRADAALPAQLRSLLDELDAVERGGAGRDLRAFRRQLDRKSTRLNSSHQIISYAVFCLKKKKQQQSNTQQHSND